MSNNPCQCHPHIVELTWEACAGNEAVTDRIDEVPVRSEVTMTRGTFVDRTTVPASAMDHDYQGTLLSSRYLAIANRGQRQPICRGHGER